MSRHEPPPTSPIGPSMWSVQAGDSGWANVNQLSSTFDNLQLNRRVESDNDFGYQQPQAQRGQPGGNLLPPMPMTAGAIGEPSWVASLVGHDIVPRPRSAHTPHAQWQVPDSMHRSQQGMLPQQWDQRAPYIPQQHMGGYGMPMKHVNPNMGQYPGYAPQPMHQGYGAPMYNNPPPSAHMLGPQDQAVIELARSKGLNPASFNCRPPIVRLELPCSLS